EGQRDQPDGQAGEQVVEKDGKGIAPKGLDRFRKSGLHRWHEKPGPYHRRGPVLGLYKGSQYVILARIVFSGSFPKSGSVRRPPSKPSGFGMWDQRLSKLARLCRQTRKNVLPGRYSQ